MSYHYRFFPVNSSVKSRFYFVMIDFEHFYPILDILDARQSYMFHCHFFFFLVHFFSTFRVYSLVGRLSESLDLMVWGDRVPGTRNSLKTTKHVFKHIYCTTATQVPSSKVFLSCEGRKQAGRTTTVLTILYP